MLMWEFINKGTREEEVYTRLERLRKPAYDVGKFHDMTRKS